jgi:hypothetical protein
MHQAGGQGKNWPPDIFVISTYFRRKSLTFLQQGTTPFLR